MDTADRRRERRFAVRWPMRAGHRTFGCIAGRVINISATGLLFLSPKRYHIGDMIELEIGISPTGLIRCVTRIVREEPASDEQYAYGAEFKHMTEEDRTQLNEVLLAMRRSELGEEYAPMPWNKRR